MRLNKKNLSLILFCFHITTMLFSESKKDTTKSSSEIELIFDKVKVLEQSSTGEPTSIEVDITTGFSLKIKLSGQNMTAQTPESLEIGGLADNFVIMGRSSYQEVYNYQQSFTYELYLRPTKEGVLNLGPVSAKFGSKKIVEPAVKIVSKHVPQKDCFAKLSINSSDLFVWQKDSLFLNIYYDPKTIKDCSITDPSSPDFDITRVSTSKKEQEVEDKNFEVMQIEYSITPKKTGKLILDPIEIHFLRKSKNSQNHQMNLFAFAFGDDDFGQWNRAVTRSNNIELSVVDLPANANIKAVGSFSRLQQYFPHGQQFCQAGEPVVLGLALEGSGNFGAIKHPLLKLPQGAKSYPSKSNVVEIKDPNGKMLSRKEFEYICTFKNSGKTQIEGQQFDFFDPATKASAQIESNSLEIFVNSIDQKESNDKTNFSQNNDSSKNDESQQQTTTVLINQNEPETVFLKKSWLSQGSSIPNWLFFFLITLIILFALGKIIYLKITNIYEEKYLLRISLLKLAKIRNTKSYKDLYFLLQFFLAKKLKANENSIDLEFLNIELKRIFASKQNIFTEDKWFSFLNFYTKCQSLNFGQIRPDDAFIRNILSEMQDWLLFFDKNIH